MKPILFKTIEKPKVWGIEHWVLSGLPGEESETRDGVRLPDLIHEMKGALVGEAAYAHYGDAFPLLAKFLDARATLSVQVHPNDEMAWRLHHALGKDEMWYLLDSDVGATLRLGFNRTITRADGTALLRGDISRLMDVLGTYEVKKGDVFSLPAGTIHAIGGGIRLAEIQEASDITYRVYDYDRPDKDGLCRTLHVEEACEAIDFDHQGARIDYDRAKDDVELLRMTHFTVNRLFVKGRQTVDRHLDSFVMILVLEGAAMINGVAASVGEALLVPACDNLLRLDGEATLLTVELNGF